jgi:hypothetical protein
MGHRTAENGGNRCIQPKKMAANMAEIGGAHINMVDDKGWLRLAHLQRGGRTHTNMAAKKGAYLPMDRPGPPPRTFKVLGGI